MTAEAVVTDALPRSDSLDSIIRAAQAGDSAAFEELMVLTERRVAQIAWAVLGDAEVCRDSLRRRKRTFEPLPELESTAPRADEELVHRNELALLRRAVDALPPKERLAVILREVEGMPTEEVATALGSTVTTVRVQISKARAKLRAWMERHSR